MPVWPERAPELVGLRDSTGRFGRPRNIVVSSSDISEHTAAGATNMSRR